jgi:uncharacterized protein YjiS (DUF1127 family)
MSALGQASITISNVTRTYVRRAVLPWHVERARGMSVAALAIEWFRQDTALRRSRRALLELTSEQLSDVGLTRRQALAEAQRSLYLD